MKLNTKKIIAREFLMILVSTFLCIIAYYSGLFIDNHYDSYSQKKNEIKKYESQIDDYLIKFRKNTKVDSIYKLQMKFYSYYSNEVSLDSSDYGNYFFWKNIRKSIQDSTFNFSYANDEIISNIKSGNNENTALLREILGNQKLKRLGVWLEYNLEDYKYEFKYFALHNNYERYISNNEWKKYEEVRIKKRKIENELKNEENEYENEYLSDRYLKNVFIFCLSVFFILRYLFYIIMWCIKILNQKEH
jgi:hypothetical protein